MPRIIITAKELVTGAVTANKAKYDEVTGKLREARAVAVFPAANVPTAVPHALGRVPTGFSVAAIGRNGGAPGTVYSDDFPLQFNRYSVILKCSTANTWADLRIF